MQIIIHALLKPQLSSIDSLHDELPNHQKINEPMINVCLSQSNLTISLRIPKKKSYLYKQIIPRCEVCYESWVSPHWSLQVNILSVYQGSIFRSTGRVPWWSSDFRGETSNIQWLLRPERPWDRKTEGRCWVVDIHTKKNTVVFVPIKICACFFFGVSVPLRPVPQWTNRKAQVFHLCPRISYFDQAVM